MYKGQFAYFCTKRQPVRPLTTELFAMKKSTALLCFIATLMTACNSLDNNPLVKEWSTPYGIPPFSEIKTRHFLPAFKEGMRRQNEEINATSEYAGSTIMEAFMEICDSVK